ncbi:hypothetical protein LCGC14_1017570, partial [marine sediment metagenome]
MMKLVDCYNKYKCDKGTVSRKSVGHRYDRIYEPVLDSFRANEFDILEIGVLKGNSIKAHLEYAPNARITGVDVFTRVLPQNIPIFNHPNVKWIKHDSTLPVPFIDERFDIIIDDGLHTHTAQRKTFENFFPYLKDDGVYFIEDVWPFDRMGQKEKQHPWLTKHPQDWNDDEYEKLLNAISPFDVTFHDIRE